MRIVALAALVACTPMQRTMTLASASSTLILADWMQTRAFVRTCDELNPIIGDCGQHISPDIYFPTALALHLAVGLILPVQWRDVWFGAVAGAQASTVWANYFE